MPTKPEFVGHFGIDIVDANDTLTLAELARVKVADTVKVSVDAKVDIDWHLDAKADAALPGIATDFRLTWAWGKSTGTPPPPGGTKPNNTAGLVIQFNNVTLNAGEFFGKALKPYLQQIVDATKPLQPIIDTIFTPMPVISDLSKAAGGDAVTIATLAEKFNTLPGGAEDQALPRRHQDGQAAARRREVRRGQLRRANRQLQPARGPDGDDERQRRQRELDRLIPARTQPNTQATQQINAKDASGQLATKVQPKSTLAAGISIPVIEDPTLLFGLDLRRRHPAGRVRQRSADPGLPVPEVVRADLRPAAGHDGHRWRRLGDAPHRGRLRHLRHPPRDRDR